MQTDLYERAAEAAEFIRRRCGDAPKAAVVLGSGLGEFASTLPGAEEIAYRDIPHWPASGVVGHAGKLVVGTVAGRRVAALAGRVHLYEGHSPQTVTFGIRTLKLLGVRTVLLTNAAGGVNLSFAAGDLMVIDDHINLQGVNPLTGPNDDRFGPRFPDMSTVWTPRLRTVADQVAGAMDLRLRHGVYAALAGPNYETPAEIRHLRAIGADAVGMSTAPEAIVARHMGMEVLGISCITNMAAGVLPQPLSHEEVTATAERVRLSFIALLWAVLGRLG